MKEKIFKFLRQLKSMQLRAEYHSKPIDLVLLSSQMGLRVDNALDLGSGPKPKNPFNAEHLFGIDIRSYDVNEHVKKCTIGNDAIPFPDNYFDVVTAFDFLEHIPRAIINNQETEFPFVQTVNEIWRVLKKSGLFYSVTPCFPMKEAFQDPTHINIMTEDTLRLYFAEKAWSRIYGYRGSFCLVTEGWLGSHYFCVLQKSSEIPIDDVNEPQQ